MRLEDPGNFDFLEFRRARDPRKKYDAILRNRTTGRLKRVPFGDSAYPQYFDGTGLGLYSARDLWATPDGRERQRRFFARHARAAREPFSSAWFSAHFLW